MDTEEEPRAEPGQEPFTHPKDQLRVEDGVVHRAEELDRVNDHAPTEGAGVDQHEVDEPLPRRPTDGPI